MGKKKKKKSVARCSFFLPSVLSLSSLPLLSLLSAVFNESLVPPPHYTARWRPLSWSAPTAFGGAQDGSTAVFLLAGSGVGKH